MALPQNTTTILEFMNPGQDIHGQELVLVGDNLGTIVIAYYDPSLGTQPTEQQINDAATDQPGTEQDHGDGPELFSVWLAKHGGDPTLTNRQQAKEVADDTTKVGMEVRALIETFNKRDNYLVNRIIELQNTVGAMINSVGNLQEMKDAGATAAAVAFPQTQATDATDHFQTSATRPKSDAVQDYKDEIDSGGADT